jgi:hypothetical protein
MTYTGCLPDDGNPGQTGFPCTKVEMSDRGIGEPRQQGRPSCLKLQGYACRHPGVRYWIVKTCCRLRNLAKQVGTERDTHAASLMSKIMTQFSHGLDLVSIDERGALEEAMRSENESRTEGSSNGTRGAGQPVRIRGGLASWQHRAVCDYIEENLPQDISLTELAAIARLSPYLDTATRTGFPPCSGKSAAIHRGRTARRWSSPDFSPGGGASGL